jgi:hypothetical protein
MAATARDEQGAQGLLAFYIRRLGGGSIRGRKGQHAHGEQVQ